MNDRSHNGKTSRHLKDSINSIEINLLPAFNNSSKIFIDKSSNTVRFIVDTTIKGYRQGTPGIFSTTIDSFRSNTAIDSFYSQYFIDSVKSKPDALVVRDGLSIYTVIKRGETSDTINSSNYFPKILSTNILSQIDYIAKKTTDKELKKYIEDLRSYLH